MSNPRFPLEGFLRPPYEWVSSLALGLSGGLGLSGLFMPVSLEAISMSSAVLVLGLWRAYQGFYIVRYRRHLGHLPAYALSSADLPRLSKALFLEGAKCRFTLIRACGPYTCAGHNPGG